MLFGNGGRRWRALTLRYRADRHRFIGRLRSGDLACVKGQRVKVLRRRRGSDHKVGAATTTTSGTHSISKHAKPGTYCARVRAWSAWRAENSKVIILR